MGRRFKVTWLEQRDNPAIEYVESFVTDIDLQVEAVPEQFTRQHKRTCGLLSKIVRVEALPP
jgi:hypothetical protein